MVIDVESIGLHGEGFAVGYVIQDGGKTVADNSAACPATQARGTDADRAWVAANVTLPSDVLTFATPRELRDWFWGVWVAFKSTGGELWADCCWPVEANFLAACIADDPESRNWEGPYPFFDVATMFRAVGWNPLGTYPREDDELPAHNPLNDARQSARLLLTAEAALGKVASQSGGDLAND